MAQSEFLKGHFGDFKTFRGPNNELIGQQEDSFLEAVLPGNGYGSVIQDNLTWRCVEQNGRIYVVTTYSAPQKENQVGAYYQYVRYSAATPECLKDTEKYMFVPFPDEKLFYSVANGYTSIQEDWISQSRKEQWSDLSMSLSLCERPNETKNIDQEVIAELACCCLYRGIVNDYSGLVIFVPKTYTVLFSSYLRYCRTIMSMVAKCIPAGLRRYLRFATNPDAQGQKKFNVFFAPEGTELEPEQTGFHLVSGGFKPPDRLPLAPEIAEVIHRAAQGRNSIILNEIYQDLERNQELDTLYPERYVRYLRQKARRGEKLDWILLRTYNKELAASTLSIEDRNWLINCIGEQLGGNTLDSLLEEDPDLKRSSNRDQLMETISNYSEIFKALEMRLGEELSRRLLRQCVLPSWTLEQVTEYSNQMRELCSAIGEDTKIYGRDQSAPSFSVLSILDQNAINAHLNNILPELIQKKSIQLEQSFIDYLPELIFKPDGKLSDMIKQIDLCSKEIRSNCIRQLIHAVETVLADDKYSEDEKRSCYKAVASQSLTGSQHNKLDSVFQAWEEKLDKRKELLTSMNNFGAYLSLKKEDAEFEQVLWKNFDEKSDYQKSGLAEFRRAYEQIAGKSWAEMEDERFILWHFVQNHQMGIWIDSTTVLNDLYSELLAYRTLLKDVDDVYMWYPGIEKGKQLPVEDVLQTINLIREVHRNKPLNPNSFYSYRNVLMCLAKAGMLRKDNTETLYQYMPDAVRGLILHSPAKKKKLGWQFVAFVEGVASILIIVSLTMALLLPRPAQDDIDAGHTGEVQTMTLEPNPSLKPQDDINSAALPTLSLQNEDDLISPEPSHPEGTQPVEPEPTLSTASQSAEPVVSPPNQIQTESPSLSVPQSAEPIVPSSSEPQTAEPDSSPSDAVQITDQNQSQPIDDPDTNSFAGTEE